MKAPTSTIRFMVRTLVRLRRLPRRLRRRPVDAAAILTVLGFIACAGDEAVEEKQPKKPPNDHASVWVDLASGLLQEGGAAKFSAVFSDFHFLHDNPSQQMETRMSCHSQDDDFTQCLVIDDGGRVVGVEYLVSARAFARLPPDEKTQWHPHNYSVLAGLLTAPGLPDVVEEKALARFVNTWGKGYRLWSPRHALPQGEPELLWSFNADGEINPQLVADRARRDEIDTKEKREQRQAWKKKTKPQENTEAFAAWFPLRRPIEGVRNVDDGARFVDVWRAAETHKAP